MNDNCVVNALRVESWLATGAEVPESILKPARKLDAGALGKWVGREVRPVESYNDAVRRLTQAGLGARGFLLHSHPDDGHTHVVNAVNDQDIGVVFLDGATGDQARLPASPAFLALILTHVPLTGDADLLPKEPEPVPEPAPEPEPIQVPVPTSATAQATRSAQGTGSAHADRVRPARRPPVAPHPVYRPHQQQPHQQQPHQQQLKGTPNRVPFSPDLSGTGAQLLPPLRAVAVNDTDCGGFFGAVLASACDPLLDRLDARGVSDAASFRREAVKAFANLNNTGYLRWQLEKRDGELPDHVSYVLQAGGWDEELDGRYPADYVPYALAWLFGLRLTVATYGRDGRTVTDARNLGPATGERVYIRHDGNGHYHGLTSLLTRAEEDGLPTAGTLQHLDAADVNGDFFGAVLYAVGPPLSTYLTTQGIKDAVSFRVATAAAYGGRSQVATAQREYLKEYDPAAEGRLRALLEGADRPPAAGDDPDSGLPRPSEYIPLVVANLFGLPLTIVTGAPDGAATDVANYGPHSVERIFVRDEDGYYSPLFTSRPRGGGWEPSGPSSWDREPPRQESARPPQERARPQQQESARPPRQQPARPRRTETVHLPEQDQPKQEREQPPQGSSRPRMPLRIASQEHRVAREQAATSAQAQPRAAEASRPFPALEPAEALLGQLTPGLKTLLPRGHAEEFTGHVRQALDRVVRVGAQPTMILPAVSWQEGELEGTIRGSISSAKGPGAAEGNVRLNIALGVSVSSSSTSYLAGADELTRTERARTLTASVALQDDGDQVRQPPVLTTGLENEVDVASAVRAPTKHYGPQDAPDRPVAPQPRLT